MAYSNRLTANQLAIFIGRSWVDNTEGPDVAKLAKLINAHFELDKEKTANGLIPVNAGN